MANADARALVIFVVLSLLMSFFRTWRYRILLNFSGHNPHPAALYLVVIVRNFCSDLLPARLGSLIYIFLLTKRLKVPLDQATSSFSLALLFDLCSVAPLVLFATIFLGDDMRISSSVVIWSSLGFAVFTAFLIYITPLIFRLAGKITAKASFLPGKHRIYLQTLLEDINKGIVQIKEAGLYSRIFVLSILIRVFKYGGLYYILYALLAPEGYTYSSLPWPKVFFGIIVPEFVVSLPISGIAGFGAYQGAWIFMFDLLGFPLETAQITSMSHHIITQVWGAAAGIIAAILLFLPFIKRLNLARGKSGSQIPTLGVFFFKLALVLLIAMLVVLIIEMGILY